MVSVRRSPSQSPLGVADAASSSAAVAEGGVVPQSRRASVLRGPHELPLPDGGGSSSGDSFRTATEGPPRQSLDTLQRQVSDPAVSNVGNSAHQSTFASAPAAGAAAQAAEDTSMPASAVPAPRSTGRSGSRHQHTVVEAMTAALGQHLDAEMLGKPDVQDRLRANAATLVNAGVRTPEQLQQFTDECHRHDVRCAAMGMGFATNVGYFAGMTAANEKLVSLLPDSILKNPALLGTIVGLGVGGLDVLCNVVGGKIATDQMVNGSDGNAKLPASVPDHSQTVRGFLKSVSRPTLLNIAKNSTRLAAPHVAAAVNGGGLAERVWADRIDLSVLDGGLGFASNAANAVMGLNDGQPYAARLLLREDLGNVIAKKTAGTGAAAWQGLKSAGEGALSLITSPTPLAVAATVGAFVGTLFAANSSIDQFGTAAAEAKRGKPIPPELADPTMLVAKRASSTAFFGVMTGTLQVLPAALETFVTPKLQAAARATVNAAGSALPDVARWALGMEREPSQPASNSPI